MFSENDKVYQIPEKSLADISAGGFAKRVLIVACAEPAHPGTLDFLKKVLLAAGLDLDRDTSFAEVPETEEMSFLPMFKLKQPASVLVFGLSPKQLGLNAQIPLYQPTPFYGATFLFSEKRSVLEPDKTRKTNLWQALKQVYL